MQRNKEDRFTGVGMVVVNPAGTDRNHPDGLHHEVTLDQSIMTNQAYMGRKRQFPQANQFGTYDYLPKREALKKWDEDRKHRHQLKQIDNSEALHRREVQGQEN